MNLCVFGMMVYIDLEFYAARSPGSDLDVKVTDFRVVI